MVVTKSTILSENMQTASEQCAFSSLCFAFLKLLNEKYGFWVLSQGISGMSSMPKRQLQN